MEALNFFFHSRLDWPEEVSRASGVLRAPPQSSIRSARACVGREKNLERYWLIGWCRPDGDADGRQAGAGGRRDVLAGSNIPRLSKSRPGTLCSSGLPGSKAGQEFRPDTVKAGRWTEKKEG